MSTTTGPASAAQGTRDALAGRRCIHPECAVGCAGCRGAIRLDDEAAMLVADLLEDAGRDGHGAPYEDGEHHVVDRARAFLARCAAATRADDSC